MAWPDLYIHIANRMEELIGSPWFTVPELARYLRFTDRKTRYWLERMVTDRWVIWRWHPRRHGWYATRQYGLPSRVKESDK